jgi:hypothetical protein
LEKLCEQSRLASPDPSEISRAIKAIERSGLSVAQLRIEPDGTIVVGTQSPAPSPEDGRPNSFDQVLGPN